MSEPNKQPYKTPQQYFEAMETQYARIRAAVNRSLRETSAYRIVTEDSVALDADIIVDAVMGEYVATSARCEAIADIIKDELNKISGAYVYEDCLHIADRLIAAGVKVNDNEDVDVTMIAKPRSFRKRITEASDK